jgi:DNA-binding CsgD family transcriptional regulator
MTFFMDKTVKTFSQIADEYGIHTKTLRIWIKPIKEQLQMNGRRLLLPWQVQLIYDFLNTKK